MADAPPPEALACLKRYFGHAAFRGMQWAAISAVLESRDAVVLMATGAGKSLLYQFPSMWLGEQRAARAGSGGGGGGGGGAGIANPFWFEAAYPYSTLSLLPGEGSVVVPQYVSLGTDTGVFLANATTGSAIWTFSNLTLPGFYFNRTLNKTLPYVVPFGRSRSSAAVDASGSFFVGSDLTCAPPFDCTDTEGLPALFAFSTYSLVPGATDFGDDPLWVTNLGLEAVVPIGSASPVVRAGLFSEREVYMVAYDGTVGITQGEECPSDS